MAKRRMSVTEAAEELAESFENGNKSHVRDTIRRMPTKVAAAVSLRVYDSLSRENDDYLQSSFMRTMTDDV
jgi:hypothetical protein